MVVNRKGQALFEFMIFLPIMIILYGIVIAISSAINGSINQQKATRGFIYGYIKGSPTIPVRILIRENLGENVRIQGMFAYLFGDSLDPGPPPRPHATCYDVPTYGQVEPEDCEASVDSADRSSPLIRVKTGYGLCGATYYVNPDANDRIEINHPVSAKLRGTVRGCMALESP